MVLSLVLLQTVHAAKLVKDAYHRLEAARTITLTEIRTTEEFPKKEGKAAYWFGKGGYFRAESAGIVDLSSPEKAWTYGTVKHTYLTRHPLPANFSLLPVIGMYFLDGRLPILGEKDGFIWHKMNTIRIEFDGRKSMTKETKLFVFFDSKTLLPVGISANLGSVTQVVLYRDLTLNPPIDPATFRFTPPKGWKQITAPAGGKK